MTTPRLLSAVSQTDILLQRLFGPTGPNIPGAERSGTAAKRRPG